MSLPWSRQQAVPHALGLTRVLGIFRNWLGIISLGEGSD